MTEPMTDKEYVEHSGTRCPYCKGDNVRTRGELQADGSSGWQAAVCEDCGSEWSDLWALVGWSP